MHVRIARFENAEGEQSRAGVIFCETEDDVRRVDEAMNQMTPARGAGTRTSVEVYEVGVDEQPA